MTPPPPHVRPQTGPFYHPSTTHPYTPQQPRQSHARPLSPYPYPMGFL